MIVAGVEPAPANADWPRYSSSPFPAYRFVPGNSPHPRRNPQGHSFGCPEPSPTPCRPEEWAQSEDYRFGIDLYNFAYWWECHEVFEGFWHAVGRKTEQGLFFQALIQLTAENLSALRTMPLPHVVFWERALVSFLDYLIATWESTSQVCGTDSWQHSIQATHRHSW